MDTIWVLQSEWKTENDSDDDLDLYDRREDALSAFDAKIKELWDKLHLDDYPKEDLKIDRRKDMFGWYEVQSDLHNIYVYVSVATYGVN